MQYVFYSKYSGHYVCIVSLLPLYLLCAATDSVHIYLGNSSVCVSLFLLCHLQSSKSELIKAYSDLGVSTEGSETDLINRLEEMLLYKDVYPKMFAKLQRTGGKDTNAYSFEHIPLLFNFNKTCLSQKDRSF